jgi:hypothetical protein
MYITQFNKKEGFEALKNLPIGTHSLVFGDFQSANDALTLVNDMRESCNFQWADGLRHETKPIVEVKVFKLFEWNWFFSGKPNKEAIILARELLTEGFVGTIPTTFKPENAAYVRLQLARTGIAFVQDKNRVFLFQRREEKEQTPSDKIKQIVLSVSQKGGWQEYQCDHDSINYVRSRVSYFARRFGVNVTTRFDGFSAVISLRAKGIPEYFKTAVERAANNGVDIEEMVEYIRQEYGDQ